MTFEQWCLDVLKQEGLDDWTVVPGEAYCWINKKQFTFYFDQYDMDFGLWLHEVAHALHPIAEKICPCREQPNYYHGYDWAHKFSTLVQKYMTPKQFPIVVNQPKQEDNIG